MVIKVLGPGCRKCERLYEVIREVLDQEGVEAEVVKVDKLDEIMDHGVVLTPGLVIDGVVKAAGKVPRPKKIVQWVREAAARS